jgi:hypothetical protein
MMKKYAVTLLCICNLVCLSAQSTGISASGINYRQLQQLAAGQTPLPGTVAFYLNTKILKRNFWESKINNQRESCMVLPEWRAADLPVFCRIEHKMALKLPVKVKFRLGSVDYVDWLEGYRND